MIIICPKCNTRYALNKIPEKRDKLGVTCKKCSARFSVSFNIMETANHKNIVVAHDDFRVINVIKKILERGNFAVQVAYDGNAALNLIRETKPAAAIIDVALPGIFGFELCEKIKNTPELKNTKVILVASIYDRTRYKRKPQNLYGADDYIEKHHIPDDLLPKLMKHLSGKEIVPKTEREEFIPKEVLKDNRDLLLDEKNIDMERNRIKQQEHEYLTGISNVPERAKKLARLIVSDIALYNQDIIKSVTEENFHIKLKTDIEEGILHLSKKIPEAAGEAKGLIYEAMKEILKKCGSG